VEWIEVRFEGENWAEREATTKVIEADACTCKPDQNINDQQFEIELRTVLHEIGCI